METFKGHCADLNRCRLLSELRRRHQNCILNRFLLKTRPLSIAYLHFDLCLLLLLVSSDVDPALFVLDLHMKYTVGVVPLRTYIVWFVIL